MSGRLAKIWAKRADTWAKASPYVPLVALIGVLGSLVLIRATSIAPLKPSEMAYRATRTLPANTRLLEHHVEEPTTVPLGFFWLLPDFDIAMKGRYLPKDYSKHEKIPPAELLEFPVLPDTPSAAIALGEDSQLAEWVNTGSKVNVCVEDEKCIVTNAEVWAVLCKREKPSTCTAIVALQPEQKDEVAKAGAKVRLVVAAL